nr:uncharacterized protein LOC127340189 [Lolium perenne]
MSAIACDEVIAAAPKDADKLAVIQPSITANCSPTAANSGLGSRANAETADRSGVLGAIAGEKHLTVFAGEHPLPRSATPHKLMPQEVAHTCAQNIGFMHGDFPRSPTREQLIAFGGISEPAFNGIRSSDRIRAQPNADVSQMERAIQLAQQRDNQGKQVEENVYKPEELPCPLKKKQEDKEWTGKPKKLTRNLGKNKTSIYIVKELLEPQGI